MKVTGLCVLVVLLVASPVLSQVPDDKLIVPGQRIGSWTLQMTIEELVGVLGRQTRINAGKQLGGDAHQDLRVYRWERVGLTAWTRDGRSILMLEAEGAPEFVTEKGVKWGMSRMEVEGAYGRPNSVTPLRSRSSTTKSVWRSFSPKPPRWVGLASSVPAPPRASGSHNYMSAVLE